MRVFLAIDLPESIKDKLFYLKDNKLKGARWTTSKQWHITLHFIGEVEDAAAIKNALSTISAQSFSLKLDGTGTFPPKGKPRVLWVGISKSHLLNTLHQQVGDALKTTGFQPETRPFSPHLTLARFKRDVPSRAEMDNYRDKHGDFSTDEFRIEQFALYESKLERTGAIYTVRAQYDLC